MSDSVTLVALPRLLQESIGSIQGSDVSDLTELLDEWGTLLDPVGGVSRIAPEALSAAGWNIGGRVRLSNATLRLLKEASRDTDVIAAFSSSQFAHFVKDGKLQDERAITVLAALGVATSIQAAVGKQSSLVNHRHRLKRRQQKEGAVSGAASEAAAKPETARQERPALSAMTTDDQQRDYLRSPKEGPDSSRAPGGLEEA